jgi:hypothetical protein
LKLFLRVLWKERIREKVFELGWEKKVELEKIEGEIERVNEFDKKIEDLINWMLEFNENQKV